LQKGIRMRLANRLKQQIKRSVLNSFGEVDVFLFGSRVDDDKKGGDIDLAIDVELSSEQFRRCKRKFVSEFLKAGFDLKVDLVPFNSTNVLLRNEVQKTCVKL